MAAGVSRSSVLSRLPASVLVAAYPVSLLVLTTNGESSIGVSPAAPGDGVPVAAAWPRDAGARVTASRASTLAVQSRRNAENVGCFFMGGSGIGKGAHAGHERWSAMERVTGVLDLAIFRDGPCNRFRDLRSARIDQGALLNFDPPRFQIGMHGMFAALRKLKSGTVAVLDTDEFADV